MIIDTFAATITIAKHSLRMSAYYKQSFLIAKSTIGSARRHIKCTFHSAFRHCHVRIIQYCVKSLQETLVIEGKSVILQLQLPICVVLIHFSKLNIVK